MDYFKLPRLYSAENLKQKDSVSLTSAQAHYLKNVMRRNNGDFIRLFDGQNGEWLCEICDLSKKTALIGLREQLKPQPQQTRILRCVFSPIKKNRMDWMIEKLVELGVDEFQPILFQNTEVRKIKTERITAQIIEACEQAERFTVPALSPLKQMDSFIADNDFDGVNYACIERLNHAPVLGEAFANNQNKNISFLIGPEGGFTADEKQQLSKEMTALDLGKTILRCETAAMKAAVILGE
jgi:16S rRNA (uracil1498-N3)-methyltransferase